MTFLPIVGRELRVAARRRSTYWTRLVASGLALFILAGILGMAEISRGGMGFARQLGPILFGVFSWLSFAFVCTSGVFLTADALSEEKREGTLGLLFLTDLRGYDVVLGKLFSHSLVAAYGLLAAFPVIGIAFLLGGVTGAEFWRLVLVLFNTLYFSLAAGVLVSAISRDAQKAMSGAVLLCGFFLLILPAVDWAIAAWDDTRFVARFSLASPSFTFSQAQRTVLTDFWTSLAVGHLLAWLFLAAASVLAPRSWQETSAAPAVGTTSRAQRRRFGTPARRAALRLSWLAENPVRWLAARDLWLGRLLWIVVLGMAGLCLVLLISAKESRSVIGVAHFTHGILMVVLNLWVASFASRLFVEAARTGTLELLLATPLKAEQIVLGQWWALRRTFQLPVLALVLISAGLSAWQLELTVQNFSRNNNPVPYEAVIPHIISAVCSLITFATGLVAVAWFGMWMGLTSRKANHAVIKTIVFVQVLPFIAFLFAQGFIMFGLAAVFASQWFYPLQQLIVTALAVALDVAFILVARRKLLRSFRELAALALGASVVAKPRPAVRR